MVPGRALLVVCVLLGSTLAFADDNADKAAAAKHYELGKRHYNLAEWDAAIEQFRTAYKLDPNPVNLFNIAQAYRLKSGHCADAATFYANYQRVEKNKKLRDSVTKVRKDMEKCAKTEKTEPEKQPEPPIPPSEPTEPPTAALGTTEPPPSPAPIAPGLGASTMAPTGENAMRQLEAPINPDPNSRRRMFGKVLVGVGVALFVGGVFVNFELNSLDKEARRCDEEFCESGRDPRDVRRERDSAAEATTGLYSTGLILAGVGGLVWYLSRKPKADKPRMIAVPMRNGAGLSWSF